MRSKNYGINVRVTEQEKQKLLENARFCSLTLSEYLRRLGLGKEVKAAITERDYHLFRMLNGLKKELPQLQKEEIISRLEAVLNELKYICAMRTFYDEHLSPYSDLLSVKDIQQITGFSSSAIVRWISTGILKAFQPGKQYTVPKDFMLDFLISPYYRRIRRKTPVQKELMDTFERQWQEKGGE